MASSIRRRGYAAGAAFERRVKKDLLRRGFWTIRAAGSHGEADIVGLGRRGEPYAGQIVFASCKLSGKISGPERFELIEAALDVGALPLLATPIRGGVRYLRVPLIGQEWQEWEWS